MTPTRPATPTDPPDLLNPFTDTTGDHHNDHRHPAPAAAGPVDAATIADRYPIPASAPSFIVQTATAEHPSAPLDNGPTVVLVPRRAPLVGSDRPARLGPVAARSRRPRNPPPGT